MKNYIQPGDTLTIPAPATVASGDLVVAGNIVGVAAGDAASGALVDVATTGVFSLPKVSAEMIALGQTVYLDGGLLTTDDDEGGNTKVGVAVALAPNPSATVKVRLSGF